MWTVEETLLFLNSIPTCNARIIEKLRTVYDDIRVLVCDDVLKDLSRDNQWGAHFKETVEKRKKSFDPQRERERCASLGVRLVSYFDAEYPSLLKEIYDPPVMLYVRGKGALTSTRAVSIVGSRFATVYGRQIADQFGYAFSASRIMVVSGMAKGIDGAAHAGAVRAQGNTCAVLGCGVDVVYPPEHKDLYERIQEHGAVVSQYPLMTQPLSYYFPQRNRIISGMTRATVVVEAAQKSGSLITARFALDEGRIVYAVPGKADSFQSQGTHNLIKQGATLITSAEEVIEELFVENRPAAQKLVENSAPSEELYDDRMHTVLGMLSSTPRYIDEFGPELTMTEEEMHLALTQLEMVHEIKRVFGGGYVRCS